MTQLNRFFALLVLFFLFGCTNTPFNKEAIKLNNEGTKLFMSDPDSAILLFDKAISLDSTYELPIQNKANVYIHQKKYPQALLTIELLLAKHQYPEAYEMKGMLLEYLKEIDKANEAYKDALKIREEKIKNTPQQKLASENYALGFTYILLGDTTLGKELINENATAAKTIPALKDSLLKNMAERQKMLEMLLK